MRFRFGAANLLMRKTDATAKEEPTAPAATSISFGSRPGTQSWANSSAAAYAGSKIPIASKCKGRFMPILSTAATNA